MSLFVGLALATLNQIDVCQVQTETRSTISAQWMCGTNPESSGSIIVWIDQGRKKQRVNIEPDSDAWLPEDRADKPAMHLTSVLGTDRVIMDVTLAIESGVYGYRRMKSFIINPLSQKLVAPIGEAIEFSDFGSWRRIDPKTIELWEADWSEEIAHQAPRRYMLTRLEQRGTKNAVVSKQITKRRYRVHADSYWHSGQSEVEKGQDPLREMGSMWTWWGS